MAKEGSHARMAAFKTRLLAAKVKAQGIGKLAGKASRHITRWIDPRLLVAAAMLAGALGFWWLLRRIDPRIVAAAAVILYVGVALLKRARGDHRPASTERLDRSQESIELNQAVWAGFVKSRFWRIAGWFKPNAPVLIILSATLSYLGLYLGSVLLQKRLPNPTIGYVFFATIGPLSFWYVVHQNLRLLAQFWENPWGKLVYALVASVTVTFCKVMADQEIRGLTQSNPSLFPSAQQAITVLNIIYAILAEIGAIMLLVAMLQQSKAYLTSIAEMLWRMLDIFSLREILGFPTRQPWTFQMFLEGIRKIASFLAYVCGGFFILSIGLFVASGFEELGGKPFNPTEALLVWSSFIQNDLGLAGSDRVCINLPPNTRVSPFNTKDPMPNEVLVAQPISTGPDRLGRGYTYHVEPCSKPTAPGAWPVPVPMK
jgi:hypothetical protein